MGQGPCRACIAPGSRLTVRGRQRSRRSGAMLDLLSVGVLVFPGTGIQESLADKARKLGIPVLKFEKGA